MLIMISGQNSGKSSENVCSAFLATANKH